MLGAAARAADLPFAETYFETIGDRDSIPTGSVTAIAEDARGLLWRALAS